MNNQRKEIDLHNMLKQSVEADETIILTGAGSSAAVEATIKDLAKAAGKTVSIEHTVGARFVRFDTGPEAGGQPDARTDRPIALKG